MHNRGASHASINTFLKYQFGASQSVSSGSITNICAAGRQLGDPCHRAPRTTARSLNAGHATVLGGALDADASALTEELQDALSAAEPPGVGARAPRSPILSHHFPASTIDQHLRLSGISYKSLSHFDAHHDARQSLPARRSRRFEESIRRATTV